MPIQPHTVLPEHWRRDHLHRVANLFRGLAAINGLDELIRRVARLLHALAVCLGPILEGILHRSVPLLVGRGPAATLVGVESCSDGIAQRGSSPANAAFQVLSATHTLAVLPFFLGRLRCSKRFGGGRGVSRNGLFAGRYRFRLICHLRSPYELLGTIRIQSSARPGVTVISSCRMASCHGFCASASYGKRLPPELVLCWPIPRTSHEPLRVRGLHQA